MNKIREIFRLSLENGLSQREISRSTSVAQSSVSRYLARGQELGITGSDLKNTSDADLSVLLGLQTVKPRERLRSLPDFEWFHQELKKKGVTRQLLWEEYRLEHPEGYGRTRFFDLYRDWTLKLNPSMRQNHRGGEKVFVDYCGPTMAIREAKSGKLRPAQIFVGVLGASNYTFAEATWTQGLPDWIGSHVRMFEFFGGVPEIVVPDNLKSAVSKACYYEPDLNPTYRDLAQHYQVAVLPARVRKPKDKAKVEAGVLLVERWIMAVLRHREFFSLEELNREIGHLLQKLNQRPFKKLPGSRQSAFEQLDRPQLAPLPRERFVFCQWKKAKVNIDYHVELNRHYYSVPFQYVREKVLLRFTEQTVEVFHRSQRIASHVRQDRPGQHTTLKEHMPSHHQQYSEWNPRRFIQWATQIGPETTEQIQRLLQARPFPEQSYRSCLGIMRLNKSYPTERLEAACRRANRLGTTSFGSLHSILKKGLDRFEIEKNEAIPLEHENLRGADYYQTQNSGELPC